MSSEGQPLEDDASDGDTYYDGQFAEQDGGETETQPQVDEDEVPEGNTGYGVRFAPILGYVPAPSPGPPRRIPPKVNSLENVGYEPRGGNVEIIHRKVDVSNAKSKFDSRSNLHYKPGGGNFVIIDEKLKFKDVSKAKVNSLENVAYTPRDGDIEVFHEKLPWLKYNKPNLPREELEKINKHVS
ncbi:unnamed protein product [Dibothriocephalus latus]|uniref:Uncharacterized protein n=1 Tax=Dibothriocephalus latus TaxID=60516 RepID=A0A3P7PA08_DIBLA|nr:unnamed protein product [Dibothriocephalus latus]